MPSRLNRFLCSVLFACLSGGIPLVAQTSHWLTAYYATYNYSVMSTSQVDYTKLTHIIYWPVIPNSGPAGSATAPGTLNTTPFGLSATTFANGATDLVTRAHAAGAKALIGIGGDQSSGATAGFQISTNSTYQATFIKNIVALMQEYGFDGVDINWEQIQTSDNSDFTTFIANLRAALTTASPNVHLLLTMPPETKPNGGRPDLLEQVYQDLDQINIQTYQMSGPYCGWETWYNSPLNNGGATFILVSSEQLPSTTNAIADYTSLGIPQSKLAFGLQFDAAVWTGGQGTSTGGVTQPKQTWTNDNSCSANPDAPNYSTLAYRLMITQLATKAGYTTNFDSVADQSWLSYDPSGTGTTNEGADSFVSFDSPTSIAKKGLDMSTSAGAGGPLGGVFIFELSGDYASTAVAAQQHPLLNATHSMQMLLPGLVTNLKATAGSTGSATLTWTAAPFATGYTVLYSTSAAGATTTGPTVTTDTATITGLTAGQEYWFQVRPTNVFGNGPATSQVTATIPAGTGATVTWATPASIPYGTPLSATQLDATASVAGSFVYTPAKGTVLPVGSNTLSVTFTPANPNYSSVTKTVTQVVTSATLLTNRTWGNVNVGAQSNAHAITFTFAAATSLTSIQVLTQGATGLDFQIANGGSCAVGKSYAVGSSCTVDVTFAPTAAGTRTGAVVLQLASGTATAYLYGPGVGPQLVFDSATIKDVDGLPFENFPVSPVVDGAGNLYISDHLKQTVWKLPPGGAYSAYITGFVDPPYSMAMDGAGNLYVSEPGIYTVFKYTPSGVQTTVGTGNIQAFGLAVDTAGNLYISNAYGQNVLKVTPAGVQTTVLSGVVLGSALSNPYDIAVDAAGNLYLADSGNNRILKITTSGTPSLFATVSGVVALTMSNNGYLYVADNANNRVLKFLPNGTQSTIFSGNVLGNTLYATDMTVDSSENLFVARENYESIAKFTRTSPPSLSFANTYVGAVSSPQSITLTNVGNASLAFPVPASPFQNPSISPDFASASATTCPSLTSSSAAAGSLAAGASCLYAISFEPVTSGFISGPFTLTDNTLNVAGSQQGSTLSGTGVAITKATVTLSGLSATYTGSPIAVTATTSPAGLTVAITYAGSSTAPTKAGSYAVVATVTSAGYSGSATGTLVIAKATPVITWATPAPITYGTVLSATQLDAKATVAGTFVYSPAAGTTPAVGTDTLTTTFTPTDTTDYNMATAKVSLVVNAAAAPQRVVWIPDYYGGLLQVRVGTAPTAITINLPSCSPNAVAVNSNKAYVVCNANGANPDKILVYNATTIRAAPAGTLAISPLQTITSSQFNSLIGITFDASNNLWVASYGNNQIDSISASTLNTASPVVTASMINSPGSPVSLVFDSAGGIWTVGQFGNGILLHFPSSQIQLGENATPDYCLATTNVGGCQYINNVFLSPEGVALYNGDVWVANNSTGATGTTPGRELVDLKFSGGTLTVNAVFGNSSVAADSPFVCPGGLYASSSHLWVNDESYGEASPACGANGDVASKTGGLFSFTPAQLTAKTTTISQVLAFSNITGRPGFGGIFVEND